MQEEIAAGHPERVGRYDVTKRLFDFTIAVPLLLLSSPLFAIIAIAIRRDSPGPSFFRQERVGRYGESFTLLKFRSMHVGAPNVATDLMTQMPSQVTRVGAFLRRTSLDELPQLINIVRGDMSLVGPRPALPSQTDLNNKRAEWGISTLLPGLTGWAQINGRDDMDVDTKVAHDLHYLQNRSLWLDLTILLRTMIPVITGRGNR